MHRLTSDLKRSAVKNGDMKKGQATRIKARFADDVVIGPPPIP
ncbi:MAG: hypothetical protein R3B13_40655 [Polyangiaceae bacterium]